MSIIFSPNDYISVRIQSRTISSSYGSIFRIESWTRFYTPSPLPPSLFVRVHSYEYLHTLVKWSFWTFEDNKLYLFNEASLQKDSRRMNRWKRSWEVIVVKRGFHWLIGPVESAHFSTSESWFGLNCSSAPPCDWQVQCRSTRFRGNTSCLFVNGKTAVSFSPHRWKSVCVLSLEWQSPPRWICDACFRLWM